MDFSIQEDLWFASDTDRDAERRAAQSMAAMLAKIYGARPFPSTLQELIARSARPDYRVDEIVEILEADSPLAVRVLRHANSPAFGLRSRCKSVYQAVTLLGPKKIREIATAAAILSQFEQGPGQEGIALLEHASTVGALARLVAIHCSLPTEDMFTCGLLHDVGKLMLLDGGAPDYPELLHKSAGVFDRLHLEERAHLGFDHAVFAGHMLALWKIPAPIPKVVAWHHQVGRAYKVGGALPAMVHGLRLADRLSYDLATGPVPNAAVINAIAQDEAATYLGLSAEHLATLWSKFYAVYCDSRRPFGGGSNTDAAGETPSTGTSASKDELAQLQCAVCREGTFGRTCPRCNAPLCEAHDPGLRPTCQACESEYQRLPQTRPRRMAMGWTLWFVALFTCLSIATSVVFPASRNLLGPALAGVLLSSALLMAINIAHTWALRTRFALQSKRRS